MFPTSLSLLADEPVLPGDNMGSFQDAARAGLGWLTVRAVRFCFPVVTITAPTGLQRFAG